MASNFIKYILIFITTTTIYAQENYNWNEPSFITTDLGGDTRGNSVMDNQGNLFIIGLFEDEVSIGDTTLYSSMDDGVFLAKYDVNHNLLWTKLMAVANREDENEHRVLSQIDIKTDNEGFIYPIIRYLDTTFILNQVYFVDKSLVLHSDVAILKLTTDGVIDVIHNIQGSCSVGLSDMIVNNGLYFSMGFGKHSTETLDSCSCIINNDTTLYPLRGTGIIGRLSETNGHIDWQEEIYAQGYSAGIWNLAIKDSSFYISGAVFSASDLCYLTDTMIVPNSLSKYMFLMKLDLEGNYDWSNYAGIVGWASFLTPSDLLINTNNDILLTANHTSQSSMNQVYFPNSSNLVGADDNDASYILVNYDSLGNVKWKDISNSYGYEHHGSIEVDSNNNIYSIQSFQQLLVFGLDSLNSLNNSYDLLLTSYEKDGQKRWAESISGSGSETGWDLHLDQEENIHIFGVASSNGIINLGSINVNTPSGSSFFIAKMTKHPLDIIDFTPQQFDVVLFPNPSSGDITIETKNEELSKIEIFSYDGKLIKDISFDESKSKTQIDGLMPNVYFINMYTRSGKRVIYKVVVE